jgi:hypothetical protein
MSTAKTTKTTKTVPASAVKAQPKGIGNIKKQTVKKVVSSKTNLKKAEKGFSWVWHGILDLSMEARPLLRSLEKGERTMDYLVQANHAPIPQREATQLTLRLRTQISVQDGPLTLAEIHYSGIANKALQPAEMPPFFEALYPLARTALLQALGQVGHNPPLPERFSELNQQ